MVKNGKLKEKQRYICRNCNKSFNDLTKSALSCTKLPLPTWIQYVKGMILGLSIRKNAESVGVGEVDGVVEMDETFIAESFKGNHKKKWFCYAKTCS